MEDIANKNQCCFTGHRVDKLRMAKNYVQKKLEEEIHAAIEDGITTFCTGMAQGVDLWAAQIVLALKEKMPSIRLICAIPYEGFERRWSSEWKQLYYEVLSKADNIKVFYPEFTYASFQERNQWMVDHSTRIIAVYNGVKGGTYNTIHYAQLKKKRICMITNTLNELQLDWF